MKSNYNSTNKLNDVFLAIFIVLTLCLGFTLYLYYKVNSNYEEEIYLMKDIHHLKTHIIPYNNNYPKLKGYLEIKELFEGVNVIGKIEGLKSGSTHAIHILEYSDISETQKNISKDYLKHFNPKNNPHSCPSNDNEENYHYGDLGNVIANSEGIAFISIIKNISLKSLNGRLVVITGSADKCNNKEEYDDNNNIIGYGTLVVFKPEVPTQANYSQDYFMKEINLVNKKEFEKKNNINKGDKNIVTNTTQFRNTKSFRKDNNEYLINKDKINNKKIEIYEHNENNISNKENKEKNNTLSYNDKDKMSNKNTLELTERNKTSINEEENNKHNELPYNYDLSIKPIENSNLGLTNKEISNNPTLYPKNILETTPNTIIKQVIKTENQTPQVNYSQTLSYPNNDNKSPDSIVPQKDIINEENLKSLDNNLESIKENNNSFKSNLQTNVNPIKPLHIQPIGPKPISLAQEIHYKPHPIQTPRYPPQSIRSNLNNQQILKPNHNDYKPISDKDIVDEEKNILDIYNGLPIIKENNKYKKDEKPFNHINNHKIEKIQKPKLNQEKTLFEEFEKEIENNKMDDNNLIITKINHNALPEFDYMNETDKHKINSPDDDLDNIFKNLLEDDKKTISKKSEKLSKDNKIIDQTFEKINSDYQMLNLVKNDEDKPKPEAKNDFSFMSTNIEPIVQKLMNKTANNIINNVDLDLIDPYKITKNQKEDKQDKQDNSFEINDIDNIKDIIKNKTLSELDHIQDPSIVHIPAKKQIRKPRYSPVPPHIEKMFKFRQNDEDEDKNDDHTINKTIENMSKRLIHNAKQIPPKPSESMNKMLENLSEKNVYVNRLRDRDNGKLFINNFKDNILKYDKIANKHKF